MKIYIMTDLEGVSGVNAGTDIVGNKIKNNDVACKLLVEEINAAVEGLISGGAKEIIVVDGHGGSNSISIDALHPRADLMTISSGIVPVTFGIDSSFDAVVNIGMHSMIGVHDGFLNHSYNSHAVVNMWLNGKSIGEVGIGALVAAYFSVPTIMISGDSAACREAGEFFGYIETVETKKGISRYSAINNNPHKVRSELTLKAAKALKNIAKFKLPECKSPFELKIQFMCPNMVDSYEKLGATRIDHSTVLFRSSDFIDLWSQWLGWAPGVHNKRFKIKK